ncbi:ABC transporter permease subunit [Peribacillus sp. SCS-37]|uniref:ABC transporter permease subunit n=1 Tax=Paraperibacillus esterisolvens TaxID=3115296 RepID=UPI003905C798
MGYLLKLIKIAFYYVLGVIGILFVSIVPGVIASGAVYKIPVYLEEFYKFFFEFLKKENWVFYYKKQPQPILEFLKEPYIYSAKIFIGGILLGFFTALLLAFLTFLLPGYITRPAKKVLSLLETMPDLLVAVLLQLLVVEFFKKTDILLFKFVVIGEETIYLAPILTLSILPAIFLYKLILMLAEEELIKPYTEYASAKGMGRLRILIVHVFRNIFPSIFYHSKIIVWGSMSSLFIIETVYNTRGLTVYSQMAPKPMVLAVMLLMIFTPFFILYQAGQVWLDSMAGGRGKERRRKGFSFSNFSFITNPSAWMKSWVQYKKPAFVLALFVLYCFLFIKNDEDPVKLALLYYSAKAQEAGAGDKSAAAANYEIKDDFNSMLKAVKDGDKELFMSFQNTANKTFYKEQEHFFDEIVLSRKQGRWDTSLDIGEINVSSADTGSLSMLVTMDDGGGRSYKNAVTYKMIKKGGKWRLNDVSFQKKKYNTVTVFYEKGQDKRAYEVLLEATSVVRLYNQEFDWKPGDIEIKLYSTPVQLAATLPAPEAYSWSGYGESIKLIHKSNSAGAAETPGQILTYEIAAKMLADLTNDNAADYVQSGLSQVMKNIAQDTGSGYALIKDFLPYQKEEARVMLSRIPAISEIQKFTEKDPIQGMYAGILLTSYLLEEKGMEKFIEFAAELKKNEFVEEGSLKKSRLKNERTLQAIQKVYGPLNKLDAEIASYAKKK